MQSPNSGAPGDAQASRLRAQDITIGYERRIIARDLSLDIPHRGFTVIVGPNACGKSTLLRALSRLLAPHAGAVLLDGQSISDIPPKQVARRLGLLPQASSAPDGISVADLVSRGRYPHQNLLHRWSVADEQAVDRALRLARVEDLAERAVDELSGGQRQRVWIAMVLAQETPLLLLDEPTTFLDIAHQVELLNLLRRLNRQEGTTIVAVLHDLNLACRYADFMVAMSAGRILASGTPEEIVTAELLKEVFGLDCMIIEDPVSHTPLIVPLENAD